MSFTGPLMPAAAPQPGAGYSARTHKLRGPEVGKGGARGKDKQQRAKRTTHNVKVTDEMREFIAAACVIRMRIEAELAEFDSFFGERALADQFDVCDRTVRDIWRKVRGLA